MDSAHAEAAVVLINAGADRGRLNQDGEAPEDVPGVGGPLMIKKSSLIPVFWRPSYHVISGNAQVDLNWGLLLSVPQASLHKPPSHLTSSFKFATSAVVVLAASAFSGAAVIPRANHDHALDARYFAGSHYVRDIPEPVVKLQRRGRVHPRDFRVTISVD
ncbi:hypothetical protein H0H93_001029 [Arthromyces matolae]|nr:hypothetical protein H0H93_001029 [Arthromyces matolae]